MSIERLLQAEQAVEARLVEARETAARIVADAYGAAQSIERKTDARIATLARECAHENDRRVSAILAEAEEIGKQTIDADKLRGAIRDAGSYVDAARRSPAVALMDGLASSQPVHAVEILAQWSQDAPDPVEGVFSLSTRITQAIKLLHLKMNGSKLRVPRSSRRA